MSLLIYMLAMSMGIPYPIQPAENLGVVEYNVTAVQMMDGKTWAYDFSIPVSYEDCDIRYHSETISFWYEGEQVALFHQHLE